MYTMQLSVHVLLVVGLVSVWVPLTAGRCQQLDHCSCEDPTKVSCGSIQLTEVPTDITSQSGVLWLNLSDNEIRTLTNNSFQWANNSASSLLHLNLHSNLIDTIDSDAFKPLTSLTHLNLASNNITTLPSHLLRYNQKLTFLSLARNLHLHLPASGFDLPHFKTLNLQHCRLRHLPVNFFSHMNSLTDLNLANNHLSHLELAVFVHLHHLQKLSLQHNRMVSLSALLVVPERADVTLENNPWPCDCRLASEFYHFSQGRALKELPCHNKVIITPDSYLEICITHSGISAALTWVSVVAVLLLVALALALIKPLRQRVANSLAQGYYFVRKRRRSFNHIQDDRTDLVETDLDVHEETSGKEV